MGLVKDKAVVIFSKSSCYMSHTVKTLISSYGAYVTEYEIDAIPNGKVIEKALAQNFGQRGNVPVIFIGQKFIGGTNEIMSLQVRGQLVPLLREARAIWV